MQCLDGGFPYILRRERFAVQARNRLAVERARARRRIAVGRMGHDLTVAIHRAADLVQRAEDLAGLVAQDEVAQPPHDLDDEPDHPAPAPAEANLHDALPARLPHLGDARAFQVLAQQHDEGRRLGHELARLLVHQVQAGELGMGRGQQPALAPAAPALQRDGLRRRLDDIFDARAV